MHCCYNVAVVNLLFPFFGWKSAAAKPHMGNYSQFYFIWFNCLEIHQSESFTIISMMLCVISVPCHLISTEMHVNGEENAQIHMLILNSHTRQCAFWRVKDCSALFFSLDFFRKSTEIQSTRSCHRLIYNDLRLFAKYSRNFTYFFLSALTISVHCVVIWIPFALGQRIVFINLVRI